MLFIVCPETGRQVLDVVNRCRCQSAIADVIQHIDKVHEIALALVSDDPDELVVIDLPRRDGRGHPISMALHEVFAVTPHICHIQGVIIAQVYIPQPVCTQPTGFLGAGSHDDEDPLRERFRQIERVVSGGDAAVLDLIKRIYRNDHGLFVSFFGSFTQQLQEKAAICKRLGRE